jgi:hypothetical protein
MPTALVAVAVAVAVVDEKTEVGVVGTLIERKTKSCSSRSCLPFSVVCDRLVSFLSFPSEDFLQPRRRNAPHGHLTLTRIKN